MSNSIFGIHPVIEALEAKQNLEKVYIQKGIKNPQVSHIESLVKKENIAISYVPVEKLNKLSKNSNHQGVFAYSSPISYISLESLLENMENNSSTPLFLLLDEITDVRNFGAIIRTAESLNVNGIIVPQQGSAPINEQTVKTSTGAVFHIPICKVSHLKDALFYLKSYGISTIAATEKTQHMIYDLDLKKPLAIIMGSEGNGVSQGLLKMVDEKAKLPMLGKTSSLNVSVACGAILYEVIRQRL
ncbi:23S rRNA (guanosine(2251)-2'-O)-methyltransferase RlmB [Mesonia sp. K7]|uniref:23S rRNA (guanosine(2251)-2'-O)-methyltransferase RlmB n=1 Tax=Mesonia sp. K7 TaxID=2218606 RepID=UPI000DAA1231|nr:23S rRNA (guanosine(2251)-2'-O)-methyltransferase RlmB [Mesonia sp. K7]PZD77533.1 23S rRNA (guanosine(2251)-2'-O)-methyltransferase RlmB [Mesonia sp. K7]